MSLQTCERDTVLGRIKDKPFGARLRALLDPACARCPVEGVAARASEKKKARRACGAPCKGQ